MSRKVEDLNRRLLRARDAMDRAYAEPLDVRAVAAVAHVSEAHFIRSFRAVFGETPHRYLQRRRVERSMFLLAMLGLAQAPALRDLPIDLDDLSLALEGDPLLTGGRLDLRTGDVQQIGPLYESDFFDEIGEPDDGEVGEADDRWLRFDSLGSRPGFRDMAEFLETVADEHLATRLDRALGGRGAFRRFKDELADVPDELARFRRFTDDRRRGRARQWLAGSGLRPTVPAEPV